MDNFLGEVLVLLVIVTFVVSVGIIWFKRPLHHDDMDRPETPDRNVTRSDRRG